MYRPRIKVRFEGIDPRKTINLMAKEAYLSSQRPFLNELLDDLNVQTCADLPIFAEYVFNKCPFVNDPPGLQQVRNVRRLLHDKEGNCVDYSVAMAAASMSLGCGGQLRMVSYSYPAAFQHVFFIDRKGKVFDLVAGQNQDGTARFQKDRKMKLGYTPNYLYHYDVYV